MTESTHVYTATLIGTPNLPLSVRGGSITLDAGNAPHVTADLDVAGPGHWAAGPVWVPDAGTLTALDPRLTKRVTITAAATYTSFGTVTRTFNLGLRDRSVMQLDGTVRLELASDEALLGDYAPLADDIGAFAYQSSLRAVVGYVLGKAIPGAVLAASPTGDAALTTYSDSTNLITNPAAIVDLTGWSSVGLSSIARNTGLTPMANTAKTAIRLNGNAGNSASYVQYTAVSPTSVAGKTYRLHARQLIGGAPVTGTTDTNALRAVVFYSTNGGASYVQAARSNAGASAANAVTDHDLTVTFPYGTNAVIIRLYHGVASAQVLYWSDVLLAEATADPTDLAYYDGSTPAVTGYTFGWAGVTGASTSTRTATIKRTPDALLWKANQSGLDFLAPLVQVAGYRLVCDENRVWTLRGENYTAANALTIRHAVNMIDATDTISRDAGLWFDAAVTTYTWNDAAGITRTAIDAYALTTPYTRLQTFEKNTPYPGPGFSQYAVRRAQGRGREVTATAVSDWAGAAEQPITVVLDGAPTQIGMTQSIRYDLNTDRMTVATRTTDTPAGAIDLLVGTIDSLVGTIDSL